MRQSLQLLIISIIVIAVALPSFAGNDHEKKWERDKKEQHHHNKNIENNHKVKNVKVVNHEDAAVPVTVTKLPIVTDRIQGTLDIQLFDEQSFGCISFPVQADERLIIDQVSASVGVPVAEDQRAILLLRSQPNSGTGDFARYFFALTPTGVNFLPIGPEHNIWTVNQQTNIYHDGDHGPLQICLTRGPHTGPLPLTAFASVTIAGRLERLK